MITHTLQNVIDSVLPFGDIKPVLAAAGPATKSIMMAEIDPMWIAAETHYVRTGRL